jgi:hypothetical protein
LPDPATFLFTSYGSSEKSNFKKENLHLITQNKRKQTFKIIIDTFEIAKIVGKNCEFRSSH